MDNSGKKFQRLEWCDGHKHTIFAKTNMKIGKSISAATTEDISNANKLYITELFQIVQFLGRNSLPIIFMFPKLIHFKPLLTNTLTHAIKMPLTLQVIHVALFASNWQFYSNDENA